MSHRARHNPRPKNRGLRRIAATLGLATVAITGYTLTDVAAAPQDTAWGAPDTTPTVAVDVQVDVTPLDTTWG